MMTLKELKSILAGIEEPIDRIASFCEGYDQMFDRCGLEVKNTCVRISTTWPEDEDEEGVRPVPEIVASLLAMPEEQDDFTIDYHGFDSTETFVILVREVKSVKVLRSATGVGISLLGREPMWYRDENRFLAEVVIEDPRAQSLNGTFDEFLDSLAAYWNDDYNSRCDLRDCHVMNEKTMIELVSEESSCAALIALLAGTFSGTYFTLMPLTEGADVERVTNDREHRHWGECCAMVYSAYIPIHDYLNPTPDLCPIATTDCYLRECKTHGEMEQFITSHHPDPAVGDVVQRVTNRYIDNPLDLILSPQDQQDEDCWE